MLLNKLKKQTDLGLLIMRIGVGIPFIILHGWPKVIAGADRWIGLGERFGMVTGFEFFPVFWGFMAAFSEFLGGILLTVGWLTRPACFFLFFTMLIATIWHILDGSGYSHSLKMLAVFAGLFFIGPGKYSIDKK